METLPVKYRINHYEYFDLKYLGKWKLFKNFQDCYNEQVRISKSNPTRRITIEFTFDL